MMMMVFDDEYDENDERLREREKDQQTEREDVTKMAARLLLLFTTNALK